MTFEFWRFKQQAGILCANLFQCRIFKKTPQARYDPCLRSSRNAQPVDPFNELLQVC